MRMGFDIDNVIYPFVPVMQLCEESRQGRKLPPAVRWDFYKDWGLRGAEFAELMRQYHDQGTVFTLGSPIADCVRVLAALMDEVEVVLCTSRPEWALNATEDWIMKWDIPHHDLVFADDKTLHGLDALLDDAPHHIEEASVAGATTYVYDQPWNWHVAADYRILRWADLLAVV